MTNWKYQKWLKSTLLQVKVLSVSWIHYWVMMEIYLHKLMFLFFVFLLFSYITKSSTAVWPALLFDWHHIVMLGDLTDFNKCKCKQVHVVFCFVLTLCWHLCLWNCSVGMEVVQVTPLNALVFISKTCRQ